MYYQEVQALRDITSDNFPNGQIRLQWDVVPGKAWVPSKSFFRIRASLKNGLADVLQSRDEIAPAMFFGDSLFQQIEFKINGKCVNKQDDYVHQIASLKQRCEKNDYDLDSFGKVNFSSAYFSERQDQICEHFLPMGSFGMQYDANNVPATYAASVTDANLLMTITFVGGKAALTPIKMTDFFRVGNRVRWITVNADPEDAAAVVNTGRIIRLNTDSVITVKSDAAAVAIGATALRPGSVQVNNGDQFYGIGRSSARNFEVIWTPCIGVFTTVNTSLYAGNYEIILTPNPRSAYRFLAVESQSTAKLLNVANGFRLDILTLELYIALNQHAEKLTGSHSISFYETRCQAQTINTESLTQKRFQINPRTEYLTVAYQDQRAVSDDTLFSAAKFKVEDERHLQLQRMYIQYNGLVLPNPLPQINKDNSEDFIVQRYVESVMYKGYKRGMEGYSKWLERGPYYLFRWPHNGSSEVIVSQQFLQNAFTFGGLNLKPQILLFDKYPKKYTLDYNANGMLTNVISEY